MMLSLNGLRAISGKSVMISMRMRIQNQESGGNNQEGRRKIQVCSFFLPSYLCGGEQSKSEVDLHCCG